MRCRGGSGGRGGSVVRGGSAVRGGWRGGRGGSVVRVGIVGSLSRAFCVADVEYTQFDDLSSHEEETTACSCSCNSAKLYNRCSLILDELLHAIASFAKRFYNNGFAHGSGGCTLFLSCLDVSYGGNAGHPLKANDCFPAKRKREEADEVVADIHDEDLPWLTIDVKTRRTLVKEEYAFQRKKKKLGEVPNEDPEEERRKKRSGQDEHELEKDLEKEPKKEHELEKELEKEPKKEVGLQKKHEKEPNLEKEPDQKKLDKELEKEAEKESEKEPELEVGKELEKEAEKEPEKKSEKEPELEVSESKYLVGSHEADGVGGALAFDVPKGEGDVEGDVHMGEGIPDVENKDVPKGDADVPKGDADVEGGVHKGEGEENKDVPTAEEKLPKV
uniref:Uncharacterized protein n=1 Tax=Chenopodium quinoa TaxID=63459 RepID=A0A803N5V1_CHEQI